MHTKSQLESMSMDELKSLASDIGAEYSEDKITLVYNIIDKESEVGSKEIAASAQPKKRGRKSKAEKEAEKAVEQKAEEKATEQAEDPKAEEEVAQPKKRGRKTKAEKVAEAPQATEEAITAETPAQEEKAPKKRGRKTKAEAEPKAEAEAPVEA